MSDPHPDPRRLADALVSVAAHVEGELEEALSEHRLSRPSFLVLDALDRSEGHTLSQRELAVSIRRTAGTLSVRLGRLERARLITREPDPGNRRSVTVTLTERGGNLLSAARPAYIERARRLVDGAGPRATVLAEVLETWLQFFEPGDEEEAPRLGASVVTAAMATRMRRAVGLPDEPGVLVMRVRRDTAADAAGLARGDLITRAGEADVRSIGDLERAVRSADGVLRLGVLRGAEPRELEVLLR